MCNYVAYNCPTLPIYLAPLFSYDKFHNIPELILHQHRASVSAVSAVWKCLSVIRWVSLSLALLALTPCVPFWDVFACVCSWGDCELNIRDTLKWIRLLMVPVFGMLSVWQSPVCVLSVVQTWSEADLAVVIKRPAGV